jgi:MerR family transcriptional regulator, light-induced transcriptional regulator
MVRSCRDTLGVMNTGAGRLRIGELARRTGVSPAVLRAWEERYRLLQPQRSAGGLRLFSDSDEERIHAMLAHMSGGLSAAEAAQAALAGEAPAPGRPQAGGSRTRPASELAAESLTFRQALGRLDGELAQQALDRLLAVFAFETVASDVLLPYLAEVGARWEEGEATIAEEHLATQVLRARLLALARGVESAGSTRAVLACPPDEHHDIALMILAAGLERRGCQATLLGANTPIATVLQAADLLEADYVVMAVTMPGRISTILDELRHLAAIRPLLLAGPGADERLVRLAGATKLASDPVAAAGLLAERFARR